MTTDEYVPDEEDVREAYALEGARDTIGDLDYEEIPAGRAEFDRFLARVRRDAAREFVDRTLLDWGIGEDEDAALGSATADDLRAAVDDVYPEETP